MTQLKNGTTFVDGGEPFKVVKYTHTHLSRGAGTIKVKVRSYKTGKVTTKTYKSGKKVDSVDVNRKKFQYLYKEDGAHVFMDPVSFEQMTIEGGILGASAKFLKEGEEAWLLFWINPKSKKQEPLELDLPPKMDFKVKEAAPGVKGNSASNVYKDATLENGVKVRVPLFINKGDKVRVDTRNEEYVERVS